MISPVVGFMKQNLTFGLVWAGLAKEINAGSHFNGTEIDIWADFWLVGITEKKKLRRL